MGGPASCRPAHAPDIGAKTDQAAHRVIATRFRIRFLFSLRYRSSVGRGPDHFATDIRAPTALFSAWTAQGMLRRMAFAQLRALIANLRAEPA